MSRFAKLQLIGPVMLFLMVLAAEAAAWALAKMPSSELLWYLNLRWFAAFQRSHYILNDFTSLSYFQLFGIALPLILIAVAGWLLRRQFLLAAASNLSVVYAGFLVFAWSGVAGTPKAASLVLINVQSRPDHYLFFALIVGSLLSFCISHVLYLRRVGAQT
jgi:hypothetical protein